MDSSSYEFAVYNLYKPIHLHALNVSDASESGGGLCISRALSEKGKLWLPKAFAGSIVEAFHANGVHESDPCLYLCGSPCTDDSRIRRGNAPGRKGPQALEQEINDS